MGRCYGRRWGRDGTLVCSQTPAPRVGSPNLGCSWADERELAGSSSPIELAGASPGARGKYSLALLLSPNVVRMQHS